MKAIKIFAAMAFLLLGGLSARAQNDLVRLKDGSVVRGTVIEYIVGDHIRIRTDEGNVHEFKANQIEKTSVGGKASIELKTRGYFNISALQVAIGNNGYRAVATPGFTMVNGWQWNDHLLTGLGVGIESMGDQMQAPIFLDGRWKFFKGSFSPFAGAMAGYALPLQGTGRYYYYDFAPNYIDKNYGGITLGAQAGFMAQMGQHFGMTGAIGYRYQNQRRDYTQYYWQNGEYITYPVSERSQLNRLTMNFGLIFQ
jgi:hypothetical protein